MRQVKRALPGQCQALLVSLIVCAALIMQSEQQVGDAKAQRRHEPSEVNTPEAANGAYGFLILSSFPKESAQSD